MEQQQAVKPSQQRGTAKRISSLEGVSGRLRIEIAGATEKTFEVRGGALEPADKGGTVDASLVFDSEDSYQNFMTGKKNPLVTALQGRLRVEGNIALATKVLIALHAQGGTASREAATEAKS